MPGTGQIKRIIQTPQSWARERSSKNCPPTIKGEKAEKPKRALITRTEIAAVFSDLEIAKIALDARLPGTVDLLILAKGVRDAAEIYIDSVEMLNTIEIPRPIGQRVGEGRKRPGGRRSRPTLQPVFANPPANRGAPVHLAEQQFVMWVRVAYLEAAGISPAVTASATKMNQGHFVRFCDVVLARVTGQNVATSAAMINGLAKLRKKPVTQLE